MDKVERDNLLAEAKKFFCHAMATDSYASGTEPTAVQNWTEWQGYQFRDGDFKLVDMYTVNPDTDKSVGNTYISYQGRTIWMMAYGGFYKKEAIPCLKAALMSNYVHGDFYAGRGREGYKHGELVYMIAPDLADKTGFERFFAREKVFHAVEKQGIEMLESLGGHDVWGMALI